MTNRRLFAVILLVVLVLAGLGSYYSSAQPDGLNAVARDLGFSGQQHTSATSDSPLAGYSTRGVENDRVSGGFAGVAGCLLVLSIGGVLFRVLRRRDGEQDQDA